MKNVNRTNTTHIARHAAFMADFGAEPTQTLKGLIAPEMQSLNQLTAELIGKDSDEAIADRRLMQKGQGFRENNEEFYGQTVAQIQKRYGHIYTSHAGGGADANAEVDEIGSMVMAAAGHGHSEEVMAKEA